MLNPPALADIPSTEPTSTILYSSSAEITTSFEVAKDSQVIAPFAYIAPKYVVEGSLVVLAPESTSGLPVTVSVKSGPATIIAQSNGEVLVGLTAAGTVVLAADQAGDYSWLPAAQVTTSFEVKAGLIPQYISPFAAISSKQLSDSPFTVTAPLASTNLPVSLSIKSGPATIVRLITQSIPGRYDYSIILTGVGDVVLAANQAGDDKTSPAQEITTTFSSGKTQQTIAPFDPVPIQKTTSAPISIKAPTATSGLPVTVSLISGPATIDVLDNIYTITLTGTEGTIQIAATQAGNDVYAAAPPSSLSIRVSNSEQIPLISPGQIIFCTKGKPVSYPVKLDITSGVPTSWGGINLPPGLSLSATTGIISGTPTADGLYTFQIWAYNPTGTATDTVAAKVSYSGRTYTWPEVEWVLRKNPGIVARRAAWRGSDKRGGNKNVGIKYDSRGVFSLVASSDPSSPSGVYAISSPAVGDAVYPAAIGLFWTSPGFPTGTISVGGVIPAQQQTLYFRIYINGQPIIRLNGNPPGARSLVLGNFTSNYIGSNNVHNYALKSAPYTIGISSILNGTESSIVSVVVRPEIFPILPTPLPL